MEVMVQSQHMENVSIGINLKSFLATFKVYWGYMKFFSQQKQTIYINNNAPQLYPLLTPCKEWKEKSDLEISENECLINLRVTVI